MIEPVMEQERSRIAKAIIFELLNEEALTELQYLDLHDRQIHSPELFDYMESDKDFLSRGDNSKAATLLLAIYLRMRSEIERLPTKECM